jgi:HD-GYP domain-containing protein (c-di-GMP phosphodiesterase class II)
LVGVDIPLVGRIVAVADVWDALTSDRAYRPAWPFDRAISHIAGGGGTLFDPLCVEAFLDVLEDSGLVPEKSHADMEALLQAAIECHPVSERSVRTTVSRHSVNP